MSFDPKKCLEYLENKSNDNDFHEEAADSLIIGHSTLETAKILIKILVDLSESIEFKNEMALCFGSVWVDI